MATQGPVADATVAAHPMSPLGWRLDHERDMAAIEHALADAAVSVDDSLTEIAAHLIPAGGKRLRPSFVVAAGLCTASESVNDRLSERLICAAVSVELVHLGSLYHDDVIDGAATRRGVETVNHKWGDLKAILAGDFLLARASELAASLSTEIAELLAETIAWLCEGQIRELHALHDISRTERSYLEAIDGKTAALFATACRIGALTNELDTGDVERVTDFGRAYGTAFQIMDDVSDIVSSQHELGKPTSTDIGLGVYTLPVICHLDIVDDDLAGLLRDRSAESVAAANALVRGGPGIETSIEIASGHIKTSKGHLETFDGPAAEGLRTAAEALVAD